MTKHWPLLDREGGHTGWSGCRRTERPWGIASCSPPRSSGWTSSRRCAGRSCRAQRAVSGAGGCRAKAGLKRRARPTRGRRLPTSRAGARPHCPPSWCETESGSSPSPSRCIPAVGAAPCWRLCKPGRGGRSVKFRIAHSNQFRQIEELDVYLKS